MKAHDPAMLLRKLARRQRKHVRLLALVERAAARLDRRTLKLRALESAIAELERRVSEPRQVLGQKGEVIPGTRPARLIFNPTSGRDDTQNAARLARIVGALRAHGVESSIGLKTSAKTGRMLARAAVRDGVPLVIVAAGDGTIDEVAAELAGSSTVLGLVPIGTMNNVARSLGIPLEIDDACALIGMGTTRHIDLGRVRRNDGARDDYFLESAGVGLSAIGALAGQAFEKRRWRILPKALRRYFESRPGTMRIELDGTAIEASTRIVTVSNAPLLGNNMLAAPQARMDDGFLDVSVYDGMGDAALVKHFLAAAANKPDELVTYRARHVRITTETAVLANSGTDISPDRSVVEIEVVPAALTMIVGNGIALTLPVESAPAAPTFAPDPPGPNGTASSEPSHPAPVRA